ncbi:unnamed protein product [Linum tenue]|uniref:Uncharacterized protein n=1 Tax=Linum tenue TaxID=586396 RepID=A0AAV0IT78_9ROSI|nr:unnamed protein product [Linum tenue]
MVATPPTSTGLPEKPPELSGMRRPATVSSSPDRKSEKETKQDKKRVHGLNLDQEDVELPVEFINAEVVMIIAKLIGRPVRVDRATEAGARAKFARACVEVDLTKPLLSQHKVEGITYLIQYEGLENICGECGLYNQTGHICKCTKKVGEEKEEDVSIVPETQDVDPTKGRVYGEW